MENIPSQIALVDNLLPQTQCERCGYKGCRPYAEAVVRDGEALNLCQPGGQQTADAIAKALHQSSASVDAVPTQVAVVREEDCIGCTKCIQACPVDAIVGASKQMHTVLASECTGCGLCIPPCPTLCIDLIASDEPTHQPDSQVDKARAQYFKSRYIARKERQLKIKAQRAKVRRQQSQVDIKDEILKSLQRVKAKKELQHESTKASRDI